MAEQKITVPYDEDPFDGTMEAGITCPNCGGVGEDNCSCGYNPFEEEAEEKRRDAAGVLLKPYTRIEGSGSGEDIYVHTQDLLDHIQSPKYIEKLNPWDARVIPEMEKVQLNFEEVAQASRKDENENGEQESYFSSRNSNQDINQQRAKTNQVCEILHIDREMNITFIPNNLETKKVLSIHSPLQPTAVTGIVGHKNIKMFKEHEDNVFYPRDDLIKAMQEGCWQFDQSQDRNQNFLVPGKATQGETTRQSFEKLLETIKPIMAKPCWSEKEVPLSQHLQAGKLRATTQNFARFEGDKVTGYFHHKDIPTKGISSEMHDIYESRIKAMNQHNDLLANHSARNRGVER